MATQTGPTAVAIARQATQTSHAASKRSTIELGQRSQGVDESERPQNWPALFKSHKPTPLEASGNPNTDDPERNPPSFEESELMTWLTTDSTSARRIAEAVNRTWYILKTCDAADLEIATKHYNTCVKVCLRVKALYSRLPAETQAWIDFTFNVMPFEVLSVYEAAGIPLRPARGR